MLDLRTGRCIGSEALIRWQHSNQGLLLPSLFIPVAEKTGLIAEIGEWVIEKVIEEQSQLLKVYPDLYTAINLSPAQLNSGASNQTILRFLEKDCKIANNLVFEITEAILIEDDKTPALDTVARLRSLGARISLDDFGTGHSGISYLHKLGFDYLKIDRVYTSASDASSSIASILEGIIDFGRRLQVELIAEGIETEAQQQFLLNRDIRYGQGRLLAYPMPIREFEYFLAGNLKN
ncbi:MAG: EAL domain-containing protein [Leptolyngbya sp. SIO1E4]|nr:EAL domain-containing protein [Leptolyngbya sp. SIO1E4]